MKRESKILFFTPIVMLPIILTTIPFLFFKFSIWWMPQLFYTVSCLITLILLALIIKSFKYSFSDFGLGGSIKWYDLPLALLFCSTAVLFWGITMYLLEKVDIVPWTVNYAYNNKFIEIPVIIVFAVIIGPFSEEILFRGFLITSIAGKTNTWIAAVISLIVFALYHYFVFGLGALILILVWGIFPTLLFIMRKNIFACTLMHAFNNLYAYILYPLIFKS